MARGSAAADESNYYHTNVPLYHHWHLGTHRMSSFNDVLISHANARTTLHTPLSYLSLVISAGHPYAFGFRAIIRYIGVNNFSLPPATKQSAASAKESAVFCVPLGATPITSRAPTNL